MAASVNRRRPGGYRGTIARILKQLERDERAALKYAEELSRRAAAGEDVADEVFQEIIDGAFRAEAIHKYAGRVEVECVHQICRLLTLNGESQLALIMASDGGRTRESRWREPPMGWHPSRVEEAAAFIAAHAGKPKVATADILRDAKALKRAYRRASKALHPDHGGNTRMMQRLTEAHETLSRQRN